MSLPVGWEPAPLLTPDGRPRVRPRPSEPVARPHDGRSHRTLVVPIPRGPVEWTAALAAIGVGAALVAAIALAVLFVAVAGGLLVMGSCALVTHFCRRKAQMDKEHPRDHCW